MRNGQAFISCGDRMHIVMHEVSPKISSEVYMRHRSLWRFPIFKKNKKFWQLRLELADCATTNNFVLLSLSHCRPLSPRRYKKRRASHSAWTPVTRTESLKMGVGFRKRFNSLSRIEQNDDGFHESIADDMEDSFVTNDSGAEKGNEAGGSRSGSGVDGADEDDNCKEEKNRQNSNEKHKNLFCAHEQPSKNTESKEIVLPPPCTCPYFGSKTGHTLKPSTDVKIIATNGCELVPLISSTNNQSTSPLVKSVSSTIPSDFPSILSTKKGCSTPSLHLTPSSPLHKSAATTPATSPNPIPIRKMSFSSTAHNKTNSVVTWDTRRSQRSRRGSSFGGHKTTLLLTPNKVPTIASPLRRSATLRNHNLINGMNASGTAGTGIDSTVTNKSTPCLMTRAATIRSHHSRNSSVISRNSSRHGRIIRLEQKATKVLGVVFFTFVILWAPFFVLNLVPSFCGDCEANISHWVYDVVTWLGYASSMVNPIFYTIFNKVFRQAFKKVLMCQYGETPFRPHR